MLRLTLVLLALGQQPAPEAAASPLDGWWVVTDSNYKIMGPGDWAGSGWRFLPGELVRIAHNPVNLPLPPGVSAVQRTPVSLHRKGPNAWLFDGYRATVTGDRLRIEATFWMSYRRAMPNEAAAFDREVAAARPGP
jgi:hypothetical protein